MAAHSSFLISSSGFLAAFERTVAVLAFRLTGLLLALRTFCLVGEGDSERFGPAGVFFRFLILSLRSIWAAVGSTTVLEMLFLR